MFASEKIFESRCFLLVSSSQVERFFLGKKEMDNLNCGIEQDVLRIWHPQVHNDMYIRIVAYCFFMYINMISLLIFL